MYVIHNIYKVNIKIFPFKFSDGDIIQLTPIKLNLLYYRSSVPNFENLSITGSAAFPGTQKAVTSALSDSTWRAIEREFLEQLSTSITEYLNQELKVSSIELTELSQV